MNRQTQKEFAHLPAVKGGVVTSVRYTVSGETFYKYRVPARVQERQRKAAEKRGAPDPEDIGQGEGCEGGKCAIKPGRAR